MRKIFLVWAVLLSAVLRAQDGPVFFDGFDDSPRGNDGVRVMFYNCENLFDTEHDSLKRDYDFTPGGNHHWDKRKYWAKQQHIAKVISAVGGWEPPALVGLAEIENRHVLLNLVNNTNLKKHHYQIVHYPSPDRRGIDVALLYRPEKVKIISSRAVHVRFPFDTAGRTRDILLVKALILNKDTLNLVVTHWPSRWGGQFQTEPKRIFVARMIKTLTDSIMKADACARVLIIGDLNDAPSDKSLQQGLRVKDPAAYTRYGLLDLMIPVEKQGRGTHYHVGTTGGAWTALDHIIVSRSLLWDCPGLRVKDRKAIVFSAPFLLEKDKNGNMIPNRSYHGMRYHGGFSDHLPVFVDLMLMP